MEEEDNYLLFLFSESGQGLSTTYLGGYKNKADLKLLQYLSDKNKFGF